MMASTTAAPGLQLLQTLDSLSEGLERLRFSAPIAHVYNPLVYAREPLGLYLERYAGLGAENLLLGMNPGPWGMAQTGIPFGAIAPARDWLGVEAPVGKPAAEHPKRPVLGFGCERQEVSGQRLWGWARETFGEPHRFFATIFVHNYCPLIFLEESGRNLTPDKIRVAERRPLLERCDEALAA
ncbi:MAG: single-stranded DNA-binding protein, partial [Acidobacteriota bacterium]